MELLCRRGGVGGGGSVRRRCAAAVQGRPMRYCSKRWSEKNRKQQMNDVR